MQRTDGADPAGLADVKGAATDPGESDSGIAGLPASLCVSQDSVSHGATPAAAMTFDYDFKMRIGAPRPVVFERLLRIEHLSRWFCGWCRIDPKVGGAFKFGGETCIILPEQRSWDTTIEEGEVLRRFAFTWPIRSSKTRVSYDLEDAPSDTAHLRVRHLGVPFEDTTSGSVQDAWRMCLGNLKSIAEGRTDSVRPDHSPVTGPELRLTVLIEAKPSAVFGAFADPTQLDHWSTGGLPRGTATVEPRPGGTYAFGWDAGAIHVTEWKTDQHIALRWSRRTSSFVIKFDFEEKASGTAIYFSLAGFVEGDAEDIRRQRGRWSEREHLVRQDGTVEHVAPREAILLFHRERRAPVHCHDRPADVRSVLFEELDDPVRKRLPFSVPRSGREIERRELRGDRQGMHPGRCDRRVVRRLDHELQERLSRRAAPLRVVVGPLEVVHRGREVDDRLVMRLSRGAGNGTKVRELAEREIQLERRGFKTDSRDRTHEVRGQVLRAHEAEEGPFRIRVAEDRARIHLRPIGQHDPDRSSVPREDSGDIGIRPNLGPVVAGGTGNRLGDPSHPAAGPTPDSFHASDVPEGMVAQHERSPGGPRPRHRPRNRARGEGRLHLVGLEELIEHVRDGREDDPSKEVFRLRGADERCEVREGHGRCEQRRLDQFREVVPKTRVPGPVRGVPLRELRHLIPIPILFLPIEQ